MSKTASLVLTMLLGAGAADAATMKATFTGTVYEGFDETGVFGDAGSDLAGEVFTMSFIYDTSKGVRDTNTYYDQVYGGALYDLESPITSVSMEVKGATYSFSPSFFGYAYEYDEPDAGGYDAFIYNAQGDSSDGAGQKIEYAFMYAYLLGDILAGADIEEPKEIVLTGAGYGYGNDCEYYGSCLFTTSTNSYETGTTQYAYAYLKPERLSITQIAAVPLPASALLLASAFGTIGALRLRRRPA
jgi:hypothetical protein